MGQKRGWVAELDFSLRIMITMTNLILPNPPLERLIGGVHDGFRGCCAGVEKEGFSRVE
jgi:hypothetical protein